VSIIIPAFNAASRIGNCLAAVLEQAKGHDAEVLVIDDGSTDSSADVIRRFPEVRLITQPNAGPAAARNRGVTDATGEVILYTDDDCIPAPGWLEAMLRPFADPDVIGAKGAYRTRQASVIARFVQIEYEDRYRRMKAQPSIDFVDTYSAAFRRESFVEMGGFDTSFRVACAEDAELSYRMSSRGKMIFVPDAIVYHSHPSTLSHYLKKKYKFAFWRVLAVRRNPRKIIHDSHTPQLMKLQVFLGPALLIAVSFDLTLRPRLPVTLLVVGGFLGSTLPFAKRTIVKDRVVGLLSPALLAMRACAQLLGLIAGLFHAFRRTESKRNRDNAKTEVQSAV